MPLIAGDEEFTRDFENLKTAMNTLGRIVALEMSACPYLPGQPTLCGFSFTAPKFLEEPRLAATVAFTRNEVLTGRAQEICRYRFVDMVRDMWLCAQSELKKAKSLQETATLQRSE